MRELCAPCERRVFEGPGRRDSIVVQSGIVFASINERLLLLHRALRASLRTKVKQTANDDGRKLADIVPSTSAIVITQRVSATRLEQSENRGWRIPHYGLRCSIVTLTKSSFFCSPLTQKVNEEVVYYDIYYDPDYAFNYSYEGINPEPDLTRPTERPPSSWTLDDTQATHERDNDATRDAEAPVTEVHLEQVGDTAVCSSVGIYPEPELTWSTEPPSGRTLSATTAVWRTSQLLYDIRSSLLLSPEDAGLVYVCTVVSGKGSKKATVKVKRVFSGGLFVMISIGVAALTVCTALWIWRTRGGNRRQAPAWA
ncbi:uncharacterized protein LOC144994495 [Oryzias latipes]